MNITDNSTKSNPVKILITGDLCPQNRIEKQVLNSDFASVFNDFIDVFNSNDLNVTDLECPLVKSGIPRKKFGPHQKAHPKCIEILKYADIGLAALANNHIMDYGSLGAKETIMLCRNSGINTVGVGTGFAESRRPFYINIRNLRFAFLNFADNEFITSTDGTFQANPINIATNYYDIKKAKEQSDYLILIIHGGNEFYNLPSPRIKSIYRLFIDFGADAVISHHTHHFSGYEIYNGKPIFYGLGNFIYDWPGRINEAWNKGFVVRLKISDKIGFDVIPLKQCNESVGVFHLDHEENQAFIGEICNLNEIIADDSRLEAEFIKYCTSVFPMYDAFIEPYFGKFITSVRKRGLFPKLMNEKKRLLLLNITRCESHRDVLLRLLKQFE
jgi:hypothetical protein